ncbi:hypothetical protein A2U01_0080130, partial [Trifolium medium]|nr:hypothetical protein [Trifolium medium]
MFQSRKRSSDNTGEPSSKKSKSINLKSDDEPEAETGIPPENQPPASSSGPPTATEAPQTTTDPAASGH